MRRCHFSKAKQWNKNISWHISVSRLNHSEMMIVKNGTRNWHRKRYPQKSLTPSLGYLSYANANHWKPCRCSRSNYGADQPPLKQHREPLNKPWAEGWARLFRNTPNRQNRLSLAYRHYDQHTTNHADHAWNADSGQTRINNGRCFASGENRT